MIVSDLTLCSLGDTVQQMPSRARWLAPLLGCAVAACSGNPGPPMRIRVAYAATGGRCVVPGGGPQPDDQQLAAFKIEDAPASDLTIDSVRISIRTHAAGDVTGTFLCDRVFKLPGQAPDLKIPRMGADSIDIFAEAYAPKGAGETVPRRVAVGSLLGIKLSSSQSPSMPLPDLRLYPDERFRCLNKPMSRPRAFHSATMLPNGQVLIVGGLTPTQNAADDAFGAAPVFLTNEAEVYDPSSGAFLAVGENDAPLARAFHNAAFVGATDDGKYQILLVGGATVDPTMPAFGINTGVVFGTRLVPFDTSGTLFNPLTTAGAPSELMVYDPVAHTATRTVMGAFKPAVFQAAAAMAQSLAPAPDGIVVAGGLDWQGMPLQPTIPLNLRAEVSRGLETPPRFVALPTPRIGASLTALGDDTALLWGGQTDPMQPAGERLAGLSAKGAVKDTTIALATAPPTQFHTATLLPQATGETNRTIIVTGGFVATTMNMGQALQPPSPMQAARLLTLTVTGTVSQSTPMFSTYMFDATCSLEPRYRPAGWESAVDLGRGRVLITGGAPTVLGACNDCEDGGTDFRCATAQASLFTTPSTMSPAREKLQIPRYGHSSTLMHDGNVLIVGGVTAAAGMPRILRDVEVYNPRPIVPEVDATTGDPDDPVAADLTSSPRMPGAQSTTTPQCGAL